VASIDWAICRGGVPGDGLALGDGEAVALAGADEADVDEEGAGLLAD
jgi:hypothetical protein